MDCPICSYPLKKIDTVVFGLLYKCGNASCNSKNYGDTARSMEELEEIRMLEDGGVD